MKNKIEIFLDQSSQVLRGKEEQIKIVLCNFFAKGHTLIEDTPGVGKTTLVKLFAKACGLELSRIQFTNDLLPSDILGSQIYDQEKKEFKFHKGPIFGELILADELNRATPKTQSALLQVMEERSINIDSYFFDLHQIFTVMATQNPNAQIGTFDLPESQLDRFCMKLKLGHPNKEATLLMLKSRPIEESLSEFKQIFTIEDLLFVQKEVTEVKIDEIIYEQIYKLLEASRFNSKYISLSNRAAIDLVKVIKSWAYLEGRNYAIPDDLHYVFPYVCGHRLISPENSLIEREQHLAVELLQNIL